MTREETLQRLQELQRRVRELRDGCEAPTVERTMQILGMYCHMARWELGDVEAMIPEAEVPAPGALNSAASE